MDHEMMLNQAKQDFIDLHKDLDQGREISLERYDQISSDLHKMDPLNFEMMLQLAQETEGVEIKAMWKVISTYIHQIKTSGKWSSRKEESIRWKNGQLKTN